MWLNGSQSEVASLAAAKASTSAVFTPYIIPDAHALCTGLHLIKKMIKSEKFLFVIPMAGVCMCALKAKLLCMLLLYSYRVSWSDEEGERELFSERGYKVPGKPAAEWKQVHEGTEANRDTHATRKNKKTSKNGHQSLVG